MVATFFMRDKWPGKVSGFNPPHRKHESRPEKQREPQPGHTQSPGRLFPNNSRAPLESVVSKGVLESGGGVVSGAEG